MTAREAYARLVYDDPDMQSMGWIQDRVWQANALDTPGPDAPFVVINIDLDEKVFGTTGVETVSYWFHIPRTRVRDYAPIDLAIEKLKSNMAEVAHLAGSDGWSLTSGTWMDTSRDLTDPSFNTITKYVTFRTATRSLITP